MPNCIDLTGQRFGRLVVIRREINPQKGSAEWLCLCDCGNKTYAESHTLLRGRKKSCGCYKSDYICKKNTKHNLSGSRLNVTLNNIMQRCYNPKNHHYKRYGGRGITVCEEWRGDMGRVHFFEWAMQTGYNDSLTIDRIDNDKGYSPDNCRWITIKENQNNKSTNHVIEIDGIRKTISQWSGISTYAISRRICLGWDDVKAVTTPLLKRPRKRKEN